MSVLDPLSHALGGVLAAAHTGLVALGLDPSAGPAWVLSITAVVLVVRLALLPLTVHGVRTAHAAARARPQLRALADRYRDRRDSDSLRRYAEERRAVAREHRLSPWGCLPVLAQLPVWFALYHLLSDLAAGTPVGPVTPALVASLGAATLLGVPLAAQGFAHGWPLAVAAALLSYLTQRLFVLPNTLVEGHLERVQHLLPTVSAAGLLLAAGFVPVALLVYWVVSGAWTLGQSAVVCRWFPTPGTPAAARRSAGSGG